MFQYQCIYTDLDLKCYDEAMAGQVIRVLQNPSRKFRREFVEELFKSDNAKFLSMLPEILDCSPDKIEEMLDDLPAEVFHWLFIPHMKDEEPGKEVKPQDRVIWPYIITVWDEFVDARVKAHAGR